MTKSTEPDGRLLDDFYTRAELANELDCHPRTVERWDRLRTGPPRTMIGGRPYYRKKSVWEWLRSREVAAAIIVGASALIHALAGLIQGVV